MLITDELLKHLTEDIMQGSIGELARRRGVPYLLVYNIVHQRVKSLSARNFRIIYGEAPPDQRQEKTDGARFRELVDLWLFLNDGVTKADLYWEFFGPGHTRKVDYRIFTGQIHSVDPRFVKYMEKKFSDGGIDAETARRWSEEFAERDREKSVSYERVRPLLIYLNDNLGVHPTTILNQWLQRYESGDLKHVSSTVFQRVLELKKKAEKALASGSRLKIERLREEIYGGRPGYTLFAEIEEELRFLQIYARRGIKRYLGRSISMYSKGECKRLPSWRARMILRDCRDFIRENPGLPLMALPRSFRKPLADIFVSVLKAREADLLSREEGIRLEKQILEPSHASDEYKKQIYGFTRFDMAGNALGMKKKAFDLMVAKNCEIFRKIGTYTHHWYLSDLYLKELSQKQYFDLITAKYEWLARKSDSARQLNTCLY